MINFLSFQGTITSINDLNMGQNGHLQGCYKLISVEDPTGAQVNFIVSPTTYFVDHIMVKVGDQITGYYDGNAPAPLIFPPQYQALVIVKENPEQQVKVDFFNAALESSDGRLKLNIAPFTKVVLQNGQAFTGDLANRNLIVIYGASTKSIPAQTTPYKIVVLCLE